MYTKLYNHKFIYTIFYLIAFKNSSRLVKYGIGSIYGIIIRSRRIQEREVSKGIRWIQMIEQFDNRGLIELIGWLYSYLRQANSSVCVCYVGAIIATRTRALHPDWPSSTKSHMFPIDLCYHSIETTLSLTFHELICLEQYYSNFIETLSIDILITNYELFIAIFYIYCQ